MGICDENRIKIAYYDQCRYASSDLNDNENEGVRSSVETSDDDGDGDGMLRPPILKFGCDTGVNDMVGQLLYDGQHFATNLHDLNYDDGGFARYYTFSWFETYHTILDLL
ncbi:hypothetical protein Peur_047733 [Populus x canadensis]